MRLPLQQERIQPAHCLAMIRMMTPFGNEAIIPDDRIKEFEAAGYTAAEAPVKADEKPEAKQPKKTTRKK